MEKRILIVEDKDKGIKGAADGMEGMEKVKAERLDLVLSSNPSLFPPLSAYEVERSFRAHPFRIGV